MQILNSIQSAAGLGNKSCLMLDSLVKPPKLFKDLTFLGGNVRFLLSVIGHGVGEELKRTPPPPPPPPQKVDTF